MNLVKGSFIPRHWKTLVRVLCVPGSVTWEHLSMYSIAVRASGPRGEGEIGSLRKTSKFVHRQACRKRFRIGDHM